MTPIFPRTLTTIAAAASCVLVSGCQAVVTGQAQRTERADIADGPPIEESALDRILLTSDELDAIMESTDFSETQTTPEINDFSAGFSPEKCLGSYYAADKNVYSGSGYTAVLYQTQSASDGDLVEQAVVVYPDATTAQRFLDRSESAWGNCASTTIDIDDGTSTFEVGDLGGSGGNPITQVITAQDGQDLVCQHAMGVVSNVIVETFACSEGDIADQGETIVKDILANAAE